jgi:hypothetical protein
MKTFKPGKYWTSQIIVRGTKTPEIVTIINIDDHPTSRLVQTLEIGCKMSFMKDGVEMFVGPNFIVDASQRIEESFT